jgi:hypothetical protein
MVQVIFQTLALEGYIQRWNTDVSIRGEPTQRFCVIPRLTLRKDRLDRGGCPHL